MQRGGWSTWTFGRRRLVEERRRGPSLSSLLTLHPHFLSPPLFRSISNAVCGWLTDNKSEGGVLRWRDLEYNGQLEAGGGSWRAAGGWPKTRGVRGGGQRSGLLLFAMKRSLVGGFLVCLLESPREEEERGGSDRCCENIRKQETKSWNASEEKNRRKLTFFFFKSLWGK